MNSQKDYFVNQISNMLGVVDVKSYPKFTSFLDDKQAFEACEFLNKIKFDNYMIFGGTQGSTRKMLGIFPEYMKPQESEYPIIALKFKYNKNYELNHRDFLGSLMALQIKREVIGDIVVSQGEAVVFVEQKIADFILLNITKVGRVGVNISVCDANQVKLHQKFEQLSGSVSSMRLDCIVAFITNKSRTSSTTLINSGVVKVNYVESYNVSLLIKPNDIITIKGYGKFIIKEDFSTTKKGRIFINIDKYV